MRTVPTLRWLRRMILLNDLTVDELLEYMDTQPRSKPGKKTVTYWYKKCLKDRMKDESKGTE